MGGNTGENIRGMVIIIIARTTICKTDILIHLHDVVEEKDVVVDGDGQT